MRSGSGQGRAEKGEGGSSWILRGEVRGRWVRYVLSPGVHRLGRGLDNDLVLEDSAVSRRHALLTVNEAEITVEDLDSRNGTFVNGKRVKKAQLKLGDVASFGPVSLRVEVVPREDAQLLSVPSAAYQAVTQPMPTTRPRSTSEKGWVPAQWLRLLARVHGLCGGPEQENMAQLLKLVQEGVGAAAGLLVDIPQKKTVAVDEATVIAVAGPCDVSAALRDLIPGLPLDQWAESAPEESVVVLGSGEPLVVGVIPGASRTWRLLVLLGSFPGLELSGAILRPVMHSLGPASSGEHAGERGSGKSPGGLQLVFPPGHVPGVSPAMRALYRELEYIVRGDLPVLITGETGAGKEHVARIIHLSSARAAHPFLAINCPGTNTELFESELFGVEARVATGVAKRDGKLKLAHGGTVLLDEIADLPPAVQAKLLRTLQESEIYPVGANRPVKVDVRIIAATNADLPSLIDQGRFRHDLYYRLAGATLRVPPLRERREDIPVLAAAIVQRFAQELGVRITGLTARAVEVLASAPWRGNVRELEHVLKRAVLLCAPGQPISAELLTMEEPPSQEASAMFSFQDNLNLQWWQERLERALVEAALARAGGRVGQAAALLGITRQGLAKKMRALDLRERR